MKNLSTIILLNIKHTLLNENLIADNIFNEEFIKFSINIFEDENLYEKLIAD